MSILSQNANPPTCNLNCSILDTEEIWWIAKVKPRQEKAFAFELLEREIGYYFPMYTKVSRRSDGKNRKTLLALFPSYVPFVSDNPYSLLKINRLATIVPVRAQTRFKKQLNQVYVANESGLQVEPVNTFKYQRGDFVKIITGPLKGIIGKIIRFRNQITIHLEVESMGFVCVSVNSFQVESIQGENEYDTLKSDKHAG